MRLHDRYLFRELTLPLLVCVGGFSILWIGCCFFTQVGEMRDAKLVGLESLDYCLATLPAFLAMVLPFILLLAMLYSLRDHARYNEITALRAAGISLWRVSAPYFIVGLVATVACFLLSEIAVPAGNQWSSDLLTRHVKTTNNNRLKTHFDKVGLQNAREKRSWFLVAYDTDTTVMTHPEVRWITTNDVQYLMLAESAIYTNNNWAFTNVSRWELRGKQYNQLHDPDVLVIPEFTETPRQFELQARFDGANGLLSSRGADIPLNDLWPYIQQNSGRKDIGRLLTKLYGRLAAPWMCFIVVLLAIPFGAPSGRRNLFYGVAGAIFLCFFYVIIQQVCLAAGMNGQLPAWFAAWLPDILFASVGIFLTSRVR